jgi:hypothetical protein
LIKKMTGAQLDLVSGYKGTLDVALAVDRGELDGVCGWNWSSAKSQKPDCIAAQKLNFLAQIGPQPNGELTGMALRKSGTTSRTTKTERSRKSSQASGLSSRRGHLRRV